MQEKVDIDEILIQQEEKIKELSSENGSMRAELETKKYKLEELDKNVLNIVKVIDKQKKTLNTTKNKLSSVEKELDENRLLLLEKDQEMIYLKSYLNTLKADRKFYLIFQQKYMKASINIIKIQIKANPLDKQVNIMKFPKQKIN